MKKGLFSQLRWIKPAAHSTLTAAAASFENAPQLKPESATRRALERYGIPQVPPPYDKSPAGEALFLLRVASEIEHALLVQYLYASYSINTTLPLPKLWAGTIKNIAVQEMDHLINVQNMLVALKIDEKETYFDRVNFPIPDPPAVSTDPGASVGFYPYPFRLEPLTGDSLAKYVAAESPLPESLQDPLRSQLEAIIQRAEQASGIKVFGHVGTIYAYLYWLFLPSDLYKGPWHDFPADCFPLKANWHVSPSDFAASSDLDPRQADFDEFKATDGNAANFPANDPLKKHRWVFRVRNAPDALLTIAQIAAQGEGPENSDDSHFLEFKSVYDALAQFVPPAGTNVQLKVPTNPNLREDPDTVEGRITNPVTRVWAYLCNTRYLMLLQELPLALSLLTNGHDKDNRQNLITDAIETEMLVGLRYFGKKLTKLPLGSDSTAFAGPPFELPDEPLPCSADGQWKELVRLLAVTKELLTRLRGLQDPDKPTQNDLDNLTALEDSDTALLKIIPPQYLTPGNKDTGTMAIQPLNSFADVQAFFNKFITDNNTDLSGSPHADFWNTDYNSFVSGNVPGVNGVKILVKGDAEHSNLILILRGPITVAGKHYRRMPADGSNFMSDEQIAALAAWINQGCPQ